MPARAQEGIAAPMGPDLAKTDIWVLAGQSNMVGADPLEAPEPPDPVDSRLWCFALGNDWQPARPELHDLFGSPATVYRVNFQKTPEEWAVLNRQSRAAGGSWCGIGPGYYFARELARHTDRQIGLIPCALGGSSMSDWDPRLSDKGDASLYGNMLQRVSLAGGKVKGVLWYQGESDTGGPAADLYEQKFTHFIEELRRDLHDPELPIVYAQICRYVCPQPLSRGWEQVREAERALPGKVTRVFMAPTIDLEMCDLVHLAPASQKRLGVRLARLALTHVYGVAGSGDAIALDAVELEPATDALHQPMRVRFRGVSGRLQSVGRPWGFQTVCPPGGNPEKLPGVVRVTFDPREPATAVVWLSQPAGEPFDLYYGMGLCPHVNLVDDLDMGVPAFGPIRVEPLRVSQGPSAGH